jgi:hypothetical protein
MSSLSLVVSSQDSKDIYPDNQPHDFTVNLKPQFSLAGQWKIGVREITYPGNVINLHNKGDPSTITFHWLGEDGMPWGEKTIQVPADASFLTPQDLINYINESFTYVTRRPETVVTTYRIRDLVQLDVRNYAKRTRGNQQARRDVPQIRIQKHFIGQPRGSILKLTVNLYDGLPYLHTTTKYFTQTVKVPRPSSGWNKVVVRQAVYDSFPSLPRRPLPGDRTQLGKHKFFSLTDVAEVSFHPCTNKFKLACLKNTEEVCGVQMSMSPVLGERMGFYDVPNLTVLQGNARTFPNTQKLAEGFETAVVHCSLVPTCQLGDTSANLLTVVPLLANREIVDMPRAAHITYKTITYVPLLHSCFGAIRIHFQSIKGRDIKFPTGAEATQVALHLKRCA